ncbi:predicted protein [Postia placenta Mad-698-R]|nr:predicted protein [Postia placenta Mad-698-R]
MAFLPYLSHLPPPSTSHWSKSSARNTPADPMPEPEPEESASEEGVSKSESADSAWSALPTALTPASAVLDKTLKLLLPLRYDGKTIIECNRFLLQLCIYWLINTSLTIIELKVQVALSLFDGDARAWATPYFAQLVLVQVGMVGTQGATTPFANEAAFATAFKARFGNLDDKAAAEVELAKLCTNKSVRKKCTAAEFSTLFKGPADCSGYGDLELCDKYLSGIPSRIYCKIELKTFIMWEDTDKYITEVEQILDISQACRPELNNFFSA